ncbi:MAG: site-2 protease family protein [Thermoplasmata archaeon]
MNGIYLFLILLISWLLIIFYLRPYIKKSKNFSVYGPALMLKFTKNRKVIDKIAKRFPAISFSKISVVIIFIFSILALGMLAYSAYIATFLRPSMAPPLTELIALPGINPVIPIGYGIAALVISVVIHEMMHGITAKKHGMNLQSVGALFLIVPIGAFVEPSEEEMNRADPIVRRRVFAAGPGINIILGILFAVIISVGFFAGAQPIHQGIYIESSSPLTIPGIDIGDEIISLNGTSGTAIYSLFENPTFAPGDNLSVGVFNGKSTYKTNVYAGVVIDSTISGYPAQNISSGTIIKSINGSIIYNITSLNNVLNGIKPGSKINITILKQENGNSLKGINYNITTVSKYSYYEKYDPLYAESAYKNQSFIGVTVSYIGITGDPISDLKSVIFMNNFYSDPVDGFIESIGLPFYGLSPVPVSLADMFSVPFSPILFWGMVNFFYWMFWINILLGITNALPFFVFDGGQFYRDTFAIAGKRFKFFSNDKHIYAIMYVLSLIVFILILWEIIVPRII